MLETQTHDLAAGGYLYFRGTTNDNADTIVVYPTERDVDVKITMGGAAGADNTAAGTAGTANKGGGGGAGGARTAPSQPASPGTAGGAGGSGVVIIRYKFQ